MHEQMACDDTAFPFAIDDLSNNKMFESCQGLILKLTLQLFRNYHWVCKKDETHEI
jgi:hypothetical protein